LAFYEFIKCIHLKFLKNKLKILINQKNMGACCSKKEPGAKTSCFANCCGGTQSKERFQKWTLEEVYYCLIYNQVAIDTLIFLQIILFAVWQMLALIPGFALYSGPDGTVNSVTHFGWWSLIEAVVIIVGVRSTMFNLSLPDNLNKYEFPVKATQQYLFFYMFILVIGTASNLIHLVLTVIELSYGKSKLATDYLGFGIYFGAQLALAIIFSLWIIQRVYVYSRHLELALISQAVIFDMKPNTTTTTQAETIVPQIEEAEEQAEVEEQTNPEENKTEENAQEESSTPEAAGKQIPTATQVKQSVVNVGSKLTFNGVITPMMAKALGKSGNNNSNINRKNK
jgi:hypothetical protein